LITQTYNSLLFGHGGNLIGTKGLAPSNGGQDQLGLKRTGSEPGRFVPDDESDAKDLIELLPVIQSDKGRGCIRLEFIGNEITGVGFEFEFVYFLGGSCSNKQPQE
jgi:hypothetical protein